jgi:hypothetical protein
MSRFGADDTNIEDGEDVRADAASKALFNMAGAMSGPDLTILDRVKEQCQDDHCRPFNS